jgi:hypothetical protein
MAVGSLRWVPCLYKGHVFRKPGVLWPRTGSVVDTTRKVCMRCGVRKQGWNWQVQALLPPMVRLGGGLRVVRYSPTHGAWVYTMYRFPTVKVSRNYSSSGSLDISLTWFQRTGRAIQDTFPACWSMLVHPRTGYRPW